MDCVVLRTKVGVLTDGNATRSEQTGRMSVAAEVTQSVDAGRVRSKRSRRRLRSSERLIRSAALLVAVTCIPGSLGGILHLASFEAWGVTAGYLGASWAVPASFVGLATKRWARDRGAVRAVVWGWAVGSTAAVVLLVGAAACVGA